MLSKKVIFFTSIAVLIALFFSLAGCASENGGPGGVKEDQPINLTLAHFWPANHPAETELVESWKAAVEEATDGHVTVTSYPGETLLGGAEIYDGVVNGLADVGMSVFSYTRGRFPLLEVFELPYIVYNNSKVASKVAWEGIKELNPQEVQDTKLMLVLATGPGDLFTRQPVHTLEDLQGMEIRATGLSAKTLEMLGAIPVAMPQSDAYESLSRGVVEGNLSPLEVLQGWRHAEVTDYLTYTPFLYNTLFFLTMNKEVWDSIPPQHQEAIEEVNERIHEEVAMGLWDKQNEAGLEFALEETGQEEIELSQEEVERWKEKVRPILDEYVEDMEGKGLPGEEALEMVKDLADKYNEIYP
ncbi:MAG: ABC transporter substrate-binding protein [Candidatus Syntrophonatronum acetioxidans]|uniref:ABC transporter substrate-binding protein n=1 Tax=Candidatus Syntrophonatronum acetioxidans TaxID=1795816 RepID=A0A424YIX5_9FIRM|nr:MAG: ABC transporter substrate-binding protein [Candidatus Syntrophonatronum acetioxidans]